MNPSKMLRTLTPLALVSAMAFGLAACGRDDGRTAGEKVDQAMASTEAKVDAMKDKAKEQMSEARSAAANATDQAAQKVESAGDKVAAAMDDAGVTAKVNAELAKDPSLSALKIDVDTKNGHVSLSGTAPDADAKDRATRLAQAVQGVLSVDNQLRVGS